MADRQMGYNWTVISAAGTTVVANRNTTLVRVVIPGTYVGSVVLHDSATTAGTSSSTAILSLGLPATSVAGHIEVGASCKNGLVFDATGTPTMTLIWD